MEDIASGVRADLNTIEAGITAMAEELPTSSEDGVEDSVQRMIDAIRQAKLAAIDVQLGRHQGIHHATGS